MDGFTSSQASPLFHVSCESWTIKKAEHERIDTFELWCWGRLLRVTWTARRSNQSTLKDINPEYSLEGLMLKLKLQYFGHLMQRANSLEKTLGMGKIEGKQKRGRQRMRWLDGITDSMTWTWANSGRWWRTGKPSLTLFNCFLPNREGLGLFVSSSYICFKAWGFIKKPWISMLWHPLESHSGESVLQHRTF